MKYSGNLSERNARGNGINLMPLELRTIAVRRQWHPSDAIGAPPDGAIIYDYA